MPATITVQVLGAGCTKCKALEERVRSLAEKHHLSVSIEKVTDLQEIMKYGIMMTPGLVIGGVLKSYGIVPREEQLLDWIKGAST